MPAWGWGFLSLIPHLIKHRVGGCRWGVGVAGWNIALLVRMGSGRLAVLVGWLGLGLARCWVLRGHLLWVLFSGPPLVGSSNAFVVGVVGMRVSGVWLCVECCIVDASILVWSSV